jgi:hypothetical protein
MQPFDGGKFDKRFEEIFKPAIVAAGLEAYRVDRDPKVSIPVEEIEDGIKNARLCFADITEDNPNVMFELGYAIACNKEVVLVCSKERLTKFPFDVQHRTIIKYDTGSLSDYETLKTQITEKARAYLQKLESLPASVTEIKKIVTKADGLEPHEITALAVITASLQHTDSNYAAYRIQNDMQASGYTHIACSIALRSLTKQGYIVPLKLQDERDGEEYMAYGLTEEGWEWVVANQHRFKLRRQESKPKRLEPPPAKTDFEEPPPEPDTYAPPAASNENDIPF